MVAWRSGQDAVLARLEAALAAPPGPGSAAVLVAVPATGLGSRGRLLRVLLADKVLAWAQAGAAAALADYAGPRPRAASTDARAPRRGPGRAALLG